MSTGVMSKVSEAMYSNETAPEIQVYTSVKALQVSKMIDAEAIAILGKAVQQFDSSAFVDFQA